MLNFSKMKRVTIPIIGNFLLARAVKKSYKLLPMEQKHFQAVIKRVVTRYVSLLKLKDIDRLKLDANRHQLETIFNGDVMEIRKRLVYALVTTITLLYQEYLGIRGSVPITSFGDIERLAKKVLDDYSVKGYYDGNI